MRIVQPPASSTVYIISLARLVQPLVLSVLWNSWERDHGEGSIRPKHLRIRGQCGDAKYDIKSSTTIRALVRGTMTSGDAEQTVNIIAPDCVTV